MESGTLFLFSKSSLIGSLKDIAQKDGCIVELRKDIARKDVRSVRFGLLWGFTCGADGD